MKLLLTVILMMFVLNQSMGQKSDSLRSKNHYYYLSDFNLRKIAHIILVDSLEPSDNYVTFHIMDSITSKKKEARDYYFPVFMKIVKKADDALAEVIGSYVLGYVKRYPKELSDRFKCCATKDICCDGLKRLASFAGEETMMDDDNLKEYNDLITQIGQHYKAWKSDKVLSLFKEQVDDTRQKWKN